MPKVKLLAMVLAVGLLMMFPLACGGSENAPRIDCPTVTKWLADPQVIIIDVRAPQDWEKSDKKIKGALRRDSKAVQTWAKDLPKDKKIVLYCA
ncbi:MAG: hypothetical protein C4567_10720 [Deltaproteobacteria bacterium]|nr:MAG: hypothetical protein C4567_10720 [Deltaproteobacteria bacterium]